MVQTSRRPAGGRRYLLAASACLALLASLPAHGQAPASPPANVPAASTHVVRPGDTLWDISRRYMHTPLRWPELQRDNAVPAPERLRPGQVLNLGRVATVLSVSGEVRFDRASDGQRPLTAGSALLPGDVLITGRNGFATVGFNDNSRVVIPSSSTVRLLEARNRSTRFELINGRIESYVEKQKQRDFEIRTRTHALGVKGTHFRVRSDARADTLEVLEGTVVATALRGGHPGTTVLAGQGASLAPHTAPRPRPLLPAPRQRLTQERNVVVADPVAGAMSYQLQLARDPRFLRLVMESNSDSPRFPLPRELVPGFYHTRLSAFDAGHVEGRTGSGIVFASRGAIPEESVAQRRADGSYEIRWTPRRSRRHTFELARSPDFAAPLVSEAGDFSGGVTIGSMETPGRYYWRCREEAEGESSLQSVWGGSFEVPSR